MSSTDHPIQKKTDSAIKFDTEVQFPEIIDDKINTEEFLQAARDVVRTVGMCLFLTLTLNYQEQSLLNDRKNFALNMTRYASTRDKSMFQINLANCSLLYDMICKAISM